MSVSPSASTTWIFVMPAAAAATVTPLPAKITFVSSITIDRAAPTCCSASLTIPMFRALWARRFSGSGTRSLMWWGVPVMPLTLI